MFIDPSVMGFILLFPLLTGLIFILRNRLEDFCVLLLFSLISASIIFSTIIHSYPLSVGYNPRDILPLAPLLTTLSAIGIANTFSKGGNKTKIKFLSFISLIYFGFINYAHSVLVWFSSLINISMMSELVTIFVNIFGFNLMQTSFQLLSEDRITFLGNNILRVVTLSLTTWLPILGIKLYSQNTSFRLLTKLEKTLKNFKLNFPRLFRLKKQLVCIQMVCLIILTFSIITIPRTEMFNVQGGYQGIKENQLKTSYADIYELFTNASELDGGVLTFKAPNGIPYYLPKTQIIDLIYPANLAYLKDVFESNTPYDALIKLKQNNINYILFNSHTIDELDSALNFIISKIVQNKDLSILQQNYGDWKLYILTTNS
jgi:hypothetical protein